MRWGIYSVCFLQTCYGLFQLAGWFPSNHSNFAITGSFDNPAGFVTVLSLGFPIGLTLLARAKRLKWYLTVVGLIVTAMAVFFSGSRTGMLAIIISFVAFLLLKKSILSRFRQLKYYKLLLVLFVGLFIGGAFILYYQKEDSANGRLLIWKVSFAMIKDKPILGYGIGAFQAKYMDYQANYFQENPTFRYAQLADNVKHPFNEFIKVAVELGIAGLTVIFSVILFVFWKITKSKNENRELVLSGLTSFFLLACFSYPLQYVTTWLFLAFYLSAMLPSKEIRISNTPISLIARVAVVVVCIFALSHIIRQVGLEMKWKTIAMSSLKGNTEEMLPEYRKLYLTALKQNPFFLYNYGAELNTAGRFDESIAILTECKKRFSDYDLQMLMADNYYRKGETEKAIQAYQHASEMIPCRFLPIYQLLEIYKETGEKEIAVKYANEIINKNVKVPSVIVSFIQQEANKFLTEGLEKL